MKLRLELVCFNGRRHLTLRNISEIKRKDGAFFRVLSLQVELELALHKLGFKRTVMSNGVSFGKCVVLTIVV